MKMLEGRFIPQELSKRYDVLFLGAKPSLYFKNNPEERFRGNYNATPTDFIFQNWIRKYLERAVFVTDMVKTEGKPGADFVREWKKNSEFSKLLLKELRRYKPKIIVALGKDVYELFQSDQRFSKWKNKIRWIYHPGYRFNFSKKIANWDEQFKNICEELE